VIDSTDADRNQDQDAADRDMQGKNARPDRRAAQEYVDEVKSDQKLPIRETR